MHRRQIGGYVYGWSEPCDCLTPWMHPMNYGPVTEVERAELRSKRAAVENVLYKKETIMQNIFEYATRKKLRFASSRGALTVEQLWDVPLRSRDDFNLDSIAKLTNRALKDISEESFIETTKTAEHARLEASLEIVKHVIDVKLVEETAAKMRAAKKQEKEQLLAILAEKQAGKLSELSVEDLQKRIAALED